MVELLFCCLKFDFVSLLFVSLLDNHESQETSEVCERDKGYGRLVCVFGKWIDYDV